MLTSLVTKNRIWGLVGSPSPSPGASPAPPKAWVALNSYGSLGMLHTMDMYRRIWGLVGSSSPSPGAFVASPAPHIMAWVALNGYGSLGMLHTMVSKDLGTCWQPITITWSFCSFSCSSYYGLGGPQQLRQSGNAPHNGHVSKAGVCLVTDEGHLQESQIRLANHPCCPHCRRELCIKKSFLSPRFLSARGPGHLD